MEFIKGVYQNCWWSSAQIIKIQCSKGDFGTGYFDDYKEKFCL